MSALRILAVAVLALGAAALPLNDVAATTGTNYAVLIAGSGTYSNYRHQADVCHAFEVLTKKGGFSADNIVVFMNDDIANSPSNPVKGEIINQPNGTNLYPGVNKDYTGNDATAANLMKVLKGDKAGVKGVGSGRVLESGAQDRVFIYFADHGGTGLICMPHGPYVYANDLISTLKFMHTNNMYKELVFYMEACESGSMFNTILPTDLNIYAVTAANPTESSYAFYYDSKRATYLGDEFSIHWLENADAADFSSEKLSDQFTAVKGLTKQSHVMQYGTLSIATEPIGNYLGMAKAQAFNSRAAVSTASASAGRVTSRDVELDLLTRKYLALQAENGPEEYVEKARLAMVAEKAARIKADDVILKVAASALHSDDKAAAVLARGPSGVRVPDWGCYKPAVSAYEAACGRLTDYSLQWTFVLDELCAAGLSSIEIEAAAAAVCA